MTPRIVGGRFRAALLLAAVLLSAFPRLVAAHAELLRANPVDGETVKRPVTAVTGRYSEDLVTGSRLVIKDASGATVATGEVDPDDDRRMIARISPSLRDGTFTVESTARSADGHVERTSWTFTVAVPATPEPSPSPSAGASPSPTTETPAASPNASPSPTASPAPTSPTSGTSDVLLPIVAALAIVLLGAGFLLSRGRRP